MPKSVRSWRKYRQNDGTGTGALGTAAEIVEYEVKGRIERSA